MEVIVSKPGELWYDNGVPTYRSEVLTLEKLRDMSGHWSDFKQAHTIVFFGYLAKEAARVLRYGQSILVDGWWETRTSVNRQTAEEIRIRELCGKRFEILNHPSTVFPKFNSAQSGGEKLKAGPVAKTLTGPKKGAINDGEYSTV